MKMPELKLSISIRPNFRKSILDVTTIDGIFSSIEGDFLSRN